MEADRTLPSGLVHKDNASKPKDLGHDVHLIHGEVAFATDQIAHGRFRETRRSNKVRLRHVALFQHLA